MVDWNKEISLRKRDDGDEPKESILKKEISFRRKPKEQEAEPQPKAVEYGWEDLQPALPPAVEVEPPAGPAPDAEQKTPLLKREISFRRTPKAAKPPKAPKPPKEPKAAKEPKPKREKAKKERAPKPERERRQAPAFLKKELSFRRTPKPKTPKTEAEQPKEKRPLLKREITFSFRRARPEAKTATGSDRARAKKVVGLKIGASQITAARVANNGHPELLQLANEPLDHGIVVAGEVREPEELAAALKTFFRKHKLPRRGVRLGIASNRIGVRTFEIAGIDDPNQLANAIRFRAQEALPIPLEEAVLDYHILDERLDADGVRHVRVLLVVAYRELVDRYVSACKRAGVKLSGIDLEAFALLRALATPEAGVVANEDAGVVVVSIGHERSTFAVSDGRVCEFTRVLDWGGWNLNVAIARALDITPFEAEPLKRAVSLAGDEPIEGLADETAARVRAAVRTQLESFARDLVSSLRFYQSQPDSLGIGEIVLAGGTSQLPGLETLLERLIGVHVRVGDPLARVKVGRRVKGREGAPSLAAAIGLGIDD